MSKIMSDDRSSVSQLRLLVREFADQRNWQQFHTPKNLAMSVAIEAAELMEQFQWLTPEESNAVGDRPEKLLAIEEEMADVFCYLLGLSDRLSIDLSDAVHRKMAKNHAKYPADQFRDRYGHDDPTLDKLSPGASHPDELG